MEKKKVKNLRALSKRSLKHRTIRRDILRYVGEKKATTFTEILSASKIPDSPTLSYHLRSLAPFINKRTENTASPQ